MTNLVVLTLTLPLAAALIALVAGMNHPAVRRGVGLAGTAATLAGSVALVAATSDATTIVLQVGAWPAGIAIPLVADLFATLMLATCSLLTLTCTVFAVARGEDQHAVFHPLVGVLLFGVNGSLLTGDLFNLFVFFEVMLIASYVLLTLGGKKEQVRGGAVYVTTNLFASTIFVAAVALMYGAAGTVNIASLSQASLTMPAVGVAGALLLVAFAVKASLVPLHGWTPVAYPVAPPAVAALFAGLLTKVGVYVIYRIYAVVFRADPAVGRALLVVALVTMVVGVLGALGQNTIRSILSFHITSQIGYMILGIAIFGPLAVAGGIFFILHNMLAKTSLFLAAGAVETFEGRGALKLLGGVGRRHVVLASGFAVAAFAITGFPPLGGFFAKFALISASVEAGRYESAAIAAAVSICTLMSMMKIWTGAFTGERPSEAGTSPAWPPHHRVRLALVVAPCVLLALGTVAAGVWADGLFELTERAAQNLVDPAGYVDAVLEAGR